MPTPAKEQTVKELNEIFQKAQAAVLANYQGIDAANITAMRAHMRARAVDFRVIKNTLAKKAAKNTPFEVLDADFIGPVSLAISLEDPVSPAKAMADYAGSGVEKSPKILCGFVGGKKIDSAQVKALAELPSKEVLISQMLSTFQGPTRNFAGVFSSLLRKLVGTLDAVREHKAKG